MSSRRLTASRVLLATLLALVSVVEIYYRSRSMLFFADEMHNLDPILMFFRTGNYTSISQGGHPFDPVLSSGILATWLNGAVYISGGSLLDVRLVTGLVQFALGAWLAYAFVRSRGVGREDALVVALAAWAALIPAGCHYLRIMNAGELWGFLYLAGGCALAARSPVAAAFVWGLGTWLTKIIYLPFCAALLAALALTEALERRRQVDGKALLTFASTSVRLGFAFIAPLLLWMMLIALRFDLATLARWLSSYAAFVVKHATDVQVHALPVYEGWSFDPDWKASPLLSHGWRNTVRYVWPLVVSGVVLAIYIVLRVRGGIAASLRETLMLGAVGAALAVGLAWFFLVDPTQWGRHLMPMIYVAMAVGLYCTVEMYRSLVPASRGRMVAAFVVYAAMVVASGFAYSSTYSYVATDGWKVSYAKTCRDTPPLVPPCHNGDALNLIVALAKEWCGPETEVFSPADHCKVDNRSRFVAHAIGTLADPAASEKQVHTAGYLLALIQGYDYRTRDSFLADLAPLVCDHPEQPVRSRLEPLGIGVEVFAEICRPGTEAGS